MTGDNDGSARTPVRQELENLLIMGVLRQAAVMSYP